MNKKEIIISPSILSAEFSNIQEGIKLINDCSCEWVHLDVMDGKFVPPISFGSQMVKSIRKITNLVLDVHLMVDCPENQIDFFADAGADFITFHIEACTHSHRLLQKIHDRGLKCGISIIPSTPVSALSEILYMADLVLVMTVNPGYGGQKLIPHCIDKIKKLYDLREKEGYNYLISADGGINIETASELRSAGLDVAVCGSSFFNAVDPAEAVGIIRGRT